MTQEIKRCTQCKNYKYLNEFDYYLDKPMNRCFDCVKKKREYEQANKKRIDTYQKAYREENKKIISENKKEYYQQNKEAILLNKKEDAKHLDEARKIYMKNYRINRKNTDPVFRIRCAFSHKIWFHLKKNNSSKKGKSISKYIPYSSNELVAHLNSLFESWMTWENYGTYNSKTWNDNDSTTWTWNIDHIIPHSEFKYTSMEDESFQKCWALSNLRPYSAKQNQLEGAMRTRHANILKGENNAIV